MVELLLPRRSRPVGMPLPLHPVPAAAVEAFLPLPRAVRKEDLHGPVLHAHPGRTSRSEPTRPSRARARDRSQAGLGKGCAGCCRVVSLLRESCARSPPVISHDGRRQRSPGSARTSPTMGPQFGQHSMGDTCPYLMFWLSTTTSRSALESDGRPATSRDRRSLLTATHSAWVPGLLSCGWAAPSRKPRMARAQ